MGGAHAAVAVGPLRGDDELDQLAEILREGLRFPQRVPSDWTEHYDRGDWRVARARGRVVGGLALLRCGQYFGGRAVPMVGIHGVAIAAEARGRGAGTRLMQHVMRELHRDGVALATLYPATQPVYRAAGFEQAGIHLGYEVAPESVPAGDRDGAAIVRVGRDDTWADLVDLYERVAAGRPGYARRSPWHWGRLRQGSNRTNVAFRVRERGHTTGYAVLAQTPDPSGTNRYAVVVRDWCASTPVAVRRLWALLADHRSMAVAVRWSGPPADAMQLVLTDARVRVTRVERWMTRIVHARAALEARGYATDGALELDLHDDLLPRNAGRLVLQVTGGRATVRRGGRGELSLDARGLAPLYTGYLSATELAATGALTGTAAALAAADALFAGATPSLPEIF